MKATEIMNRNVVTIDALASIAQAAQLMQQKNIRALIVDRTSDRDAYGIITQTDIAQAVAHANNPEITYVCEVMTKPCIVVNPDLAVEHIANLFTRANIRIAPVIKDNLLGIVSLTDLLTKTNCFTSNKAKLTSQQDQELAVFPLDESLKAKSDRIYDIWCSG